MRSPYAFEKFYRGKTEGMDAFDRMDFDPKFESMVRSVSTDTSSVDDKAFNSMKKSSY